MQSLREPTEAEILHDLEEIPTPESEPGIPPEMVKELRDSLEFLKAEGARLGLITKEPEPDREADKAVKDEILKHLPQPAPDKQLELDLDKSDYPEDRDHEKTDLEPDYPNI